MKLPQIKIITVLAFAQLTSTSNAERVLHVEAGAKEGGNGSAENPYQNLAQARDAIRSLRKAGEAVTIEIGPGVYPLQASFELKAEDSGTAEAPVVYRARENGKARFQGGVALEPANFKPVSDVKVLSRLDAAVRDKVRVCELATEVPELKNAFHGAPAAPWLYVNHQPMTLARWPNIIADNGGWAKFSKTVDTGLPQPNATDSALHEAHPGSFVFDDSRPARWNLEEGVWLLGYWTHDWSDEVIRIDSYDANAKVIKLAAPHSYGINAGTWGDKERRFFAMNALEELDAPGEWYLDRESRQLYFYPGADLVGAEIVLATLTDALVKVDGAKHVKIVGIDFEYGHADGIIVQNAEHLEIAGCVVANLAGRAISIDGSANVVRSCDVFNIGSSGISLRGGDRKMLISSKNRAENNHIHHFGLFQRTYAPGIGVSGCGQIVRNNHIHDAPHSAVLYGGNEHLFERNEISRVVMETGDAGAFYTGRDWTSQGNVLRHNYIHDLGGGDAEHVNTMGIYLDDCDSGDTLKGNVFYRAGRAMMIGGGRDNTLLNNLVIDCPIGLHIDARGMTWKQWNNPAEAGWALEEKAEGLGYTSPPWSTKYPRLAAIMNESPREPLGNTIRRNVFVDCTKQVCNLGSDVKKLLDKFDIADNLVVKTSDASKGSEVEGFTDLTAEQLDPSRDIRSGWQEKIQKVMPSFESIPFNEIGLYKDEYRTTLE